MTQDSSPAELHHVLTTEVSASKIGFVEMGKLLYELKQGDKYKEAVGEGIDTWQSYLAQPEIGLSVSEANRLIQMYEVFILEVGLAEEHLATIPIKNLHLLLPIAKKYESITDLLSLISDAAVLSQRDFKERLQDVKDDSGVRTYEYLVMRKCKETGTMRKVHEVSSELIKDTFSLEEF